MLPFARLTERVDSRTVAFPCDSRDRAPRCACRNGASRKLPRVHKSHFCRGAGPCGAPCGHDPAPSSHAVCGVLPGPDLVGPGPPPRARAQPGRVPRGALVLPLTPQTLLQTRHAHGCVHPAERNSGPRLPHSLLTRVLTDIPRREHMILRQRLSTTLRRQLHSRTLRTPAVEEHRMVYTLRQPRARHHEPRHQRRPLWGRKMPPLGMKMNEILYYRNANFILHPF